MLAFSPQCLTSSNFSVVLPILFLSLLFVLSTLFYIPKIRSDWINLIRPGSTGSGQCRPNGWWDVINGKRVIYLKCHFWWLLFHSLQ